MVKQRDISIMFAIVLSTFASTSLFAQGTATALPNEPVTITATEEAQVGDQSQQSDQARRASPPPQNKDNEQTSVSQTGIIIGTITDVNDTPVPSASVTLQGPDSS